MNEIDKIKSRYDKRKTEHLDDKYSFLNSYVRAVHREKEDTIINLFPKNIDGNELLQDRVEAAKRKLPADIHIYEGDASIISSEKKYDIVYQSTVFTSILDEDLKHKVADKMWELTSQGGISLMVRLYI